MEMFDLNGTFVILFQVLISGNSSFKILTVLDEAVAV